MSKEELEIISRRFEDKLAQLMPKEEFLPFVRCVVEEARLMVENAPTVDAVEVVRCKDCVGCDRDDGSPWCGLVGLHVDDDHYCAWGERKDEIG